MARVLPRFQFSRAQEGKLFTRGGPVFIGVTRFADRVLARARVYAPERSGKLKRSIYKVAVLTPRGVTYQVGSDLDYAEAVHEGTKAHTIRPVSARRMVFEVHGRKVFAKEVQHPGSKGQPFLRRALAEEMTRGV